MLKCLVCQHEEFSVNQLGAEEHVGEDKEREALDEITLGRSSYSGWRIEHYIYGHCCKKCGFIMFFNQDKTEE